MIKIINVADFIPESMQASVTQEILQTVCIDVMSAARAFWIKTAQARLHRSRFDYVNGIQQVAVNGAEVSISLLGTVPNLVEDGQDPYDMHTTLLGPQVPVVPAGSGQKGKHQRKDGGYWRVVPFRHQTPGTIGQGGGTPMGEQYDDHDAVEDAKKLGELVYAAAKKLEGSKAMPGGKVMWGGRLPAGMAPKLKPHHTTDIFAGMVKQEKEYKNATQSTYMTFRTISDAVPDKWQHPGLEPANLGDDVQKYIEDTAAAALQALVIE